MIETIKKCGKLREKYRDLIFGVLQKISWAFSDALDAELRWEFEKPSMLDEEVICFWIDKSNEEEKNGEPIFSATIGGEKISLGDIINEIFPEFKENGFILKSEDAVSKSEAENLKWFLKELREKEEKLEVEKKQVKKLKKE